MKKQLINTKRIMTHRALTSTSEKDNGSLLSLFSSAVEAKPKVRGTFGFTLVETLVAVSVLLISLAGPLSIAAQAIQGAYYSRDQITAFYLAQEGIEYVRAIRDQNYLEGNAWTTGIDNCIGASCIVDFPNFTHDVCSGSCEKVKIGDSSGLFNHAGGSDSIYTRAIKLETVEGTTDELVIVVTVSWQSGRFERSFELNERIFDWL